jgi:ribose transport system ATP-binding protein
LGNAATAGAGVLVVSSDFEEVATLCDRALVIGRGRITADLHGRELTIDNLLACSSLGRAESATG